MKNEMLSVIHNRSIAQSKDRSRSPLHLAIMCGFASLLLSSHVVAVDPPPDGGYANYNTAEGESALFSLTYGAGNTAVGNSALLLVTTGNDNTAVGWSALANNNGSFNTAVGMFALAYNTSGTFNTAVGQDALANNTTASDNTAIGYNALVSNTTGEFNNATGSNALFSNTTGAGNTATGAGALYYNTDGLENTATGVAALQSNTTGYRNTATGAGAMLYNTIGSDNTATGDDVLLNNSTGSQNTASGLDALYYNTIGNSNTATGYYALLLNGTGNSNTAIGNLALSGNTTGSSNIAIGDSAGSSLTTGSNNIEIGHSGNAGESNTIRIGKKGVQTKTLIAGIRGTTVSGGIAVMIDANGRLGTTTSSARFKDDIRPMDKLSEAIHSLKPVIFRYKKELDPAGIPQFGLVAEEVEKVNPDLVVRDDEGKPYSVRYDAVNAMLLNEFLKEHRKMEQLTKDFESELTEQQTQIQQLTAALQKVSAQLELSKPAPQTVLKQPLKRLTNRSN